jgi:succinate dehydrogenase assembly factor 1
VNRWQGQVQRLIHSRKEFRMHLDLDKKNFGTIEYLLRKGQRQLEMYRLPGITNILG